jgi:pimeloyl-ACP methyl ester carboxylesterase
MVKIFFPIALVICAFLSTLCLNESKASEKTAGNLSTELVEFKTGRGVTLKYVLIKPVNPSAIVVLLPGGSGTLNISGTTSDFVIGASNDFMVRNRNSIAENGFLVALIDAPSDMGADGMTIGFRVSQDHADDIRDVVSRLKEESDLPVWLIGISAASYSATNIAIRLGEEIHGFVLASASTNPSVEDTSGFPYPNGILDMDLDSIVVPTLIVAHEDDKCPGTPPTGAPLIQNELINSTHVEVKYFTGGNEPESRACGPLSPHTFYGIDTEVVATFTDFIVPYTLVPNIQANGSDETVSILEGEKLDVTIDLNPGSYSGENTDWWLVMDAPAGLQYYDLNGGWLAGLSVTYQGPLINLTTPVELLLTGLPTGTYTFYFGVDMNMNGSLDIAQLYYDSVVVDVTE